MNTPSLPATAPGVWIAATLASCCTSLLLLSTVVSIGDSQRAELLADRAAACQPAQG